MINKRNYINYATMIDSECDTGRNQPMISPNSSFYRSPLRDRENKMNISNTPLRSGKTSLSPLRMRKGDSNNVSNMSVRTNHSKRKQVVQKIQQSCFNHPQKTAKFYVQAPQQVMYCCQKCAILLASQGFKVCKLESAVQESSGRQSNPRKFQIQHFMSTLQNLTKTLKLNEGSLQQKFSSAEIQLENQLNKIQDYYEQFYQILNEHKKRVVLQVREQYEKNNKQVLQMRKQLRQAVQQTESMKKDIVESWEDIIFVAEEHQYRPVINAYNQKLQNYQRLGSMREGLSDLIVRKLNFKNTDAAYQALEKGLQVEWQDQYKQEDQDGQTSQKQESQMGKYSKQSELPQNPVQCLQKEQKFIKSSLKDLVGLFSSFEE